MCLDMELIDIIGRHRLLEDSVVCLFFFGAKNNVSLKRKIIINAHLKREKKKRKKKKRGRPDNDSPSLFCSGSSSTFQRACVSD